MKAMTVTVGDLIATVFDIVGDHVDQVVDLLKFDDLKRRTMLVVVDQQSARPAAKHHR